MTYIKPEVFAKSSTCPICGAIAKQNWWMISFSQSEYANNDSNEIRVGTCQHCEKSTLWIHNEMYFPSIGNAPTPNSEMSESVKTIYLEAASIYSKSPRGAAALLRLAVQLLCKELGQKGENINDDIKQLVKQGLPELVQQSLDIVRLTGNDAVHPGQIDTDNSEVVIHLFNLINVIVEYMIALPKKVSGIYGSLPVYSIKTIEKRDNKSVKQ
jgi:hypothetical protein